MIINSCRICGSTRTEILYERLFYYIKGRHFLNQYNACVCNNCGFGFASGIPDQVWFNQYYKECSKYDGAVDYKDKTSFEYNFLFVDAVCGFFKGSNTSILEIGCAMGDLLQYLRDIGFTNVYGADPSHKCAANVISCGIPCVCASIDDLETNHQYDVVIMVAVLEHICDLTGTIKKLSLVLNDDGKLIFVVPNVKKFSTVGHPPFQEFSTEHINYFSEQSLANYAAVNGFRQIAAIPHDNNNALISVMCKGSDGNIKYDPDTKIALTRYINESIKTETQIEKILSPYYGKPLVVWGVGTFTRHLLANGILTRSDIQAFVDKNPLYSGGIITVNGRRLSVVLPEQLEADVNVPIYISSRFYQDEIIKEIREKYSLLNKIVSLF